MRIAAAETPGHLAVQALFSLLPLGIGSYAVYEGHLMGWIFIAFGLYWAGRQVRSELSRRRFGDVHLEMAHPLRRGERASGKLVLPRGAAGANEIVATLRCWQYERVHLRGKWETRTTELWKAESRAPVLGNAAGAEATLQFDLPADAPLTAGEAVSWGIQATAKMPGVDLDRQFPIEVVDRPASKMIE